MAQKRSKPGPLITAVTGSGKRKAVAALGPEYLTSRSSFQDTIDPVAWLAARANVAASTARLHAELFGFAERRS
ncbi:hypothetical protein [Lichenibacterium ramalinae]|uniref:hypothetical protein n=1 Tax=Lichenibacterium ramalinae TaxID=2316527 RepID=UPI00100E9E93|nr:hypothetical protein [Lichenibacterium ramalinae]